jgi:N-acetylglucosamine-6-phosphate deacetylase
MPEAPFSSDEARQPVPVEWTSPGLVDLQVNGYAGVDFNGPVESLTAEAFHRVRVALARRGVVVALPTLITCSRSDLLNRVRRYARIVEADSILAGVFPYLHLEGPFISPEDGPRGAHPAAYCQTPHDAPDWLDALWEASEGRIGVVTLAPELPGALDLIARAVSRGIVVALGHTAAGTEALDRAVRAGARFSTHLGNGSHQTLPRLDNYVQTQLADDRLWASFIADGHHMPFSTLKNFIRAKTPGRSILVTDAMAAAEVGPGRYTFLGEEVLVSEDLRVSNPGQPNLAGSALTLDRAVVNVTRHCGIPFEQAWAMASTSPAALLKLPDLTEIRVRVEEGGFRRVESGITP